MSDNPYDRVAIADGITADLQAMDKEETPPPEPEAKAAPEEKAAPAQREDAPAPVAQQDSAPIALTDKSIVIDPADGEPKEWGKIKSERMAHAAATKKFMEAAQMRREAEELKNQLAFEKEQAALAAKRAGLPALPDDDPYAQHQKALQEQLDAIASYQMAMKQQLEEQVVSRELEASRMALDAKEKQLMSDHGLDKRELDLVEREYYFRSNAGEQVDIDGIAKEHAAWKAALKAQGAEEFKNKHRTNTPVAAASTPGAATEEEKLVPGTRSFREKMREEIAALMS